MAEEKKQVEQITSQEKDFAKWYTDVCLKSELCTYSGVKGFVVIRPYGWALWENIMNNVDARLKKMGVTNVAMPLLIPEHLLLKEKEHVEGFAPECAWVSCGGDDILEDRLAVRPTSETVFCDYWHDTVHSYRDLPQLLCQWGSVVRWEKETRPFLRTREFFWHEGHTLHATAEDSLKFTLDILYMYEDFIQNDAAIPVLKGKKTEKERFAGAQATYTVESIMKDGKALQSGTSHDFGDNFAKAFDIKYLDKNNKLMYATETSWAISSRIIGALIMVHGDDNGLKLPPHLAPIQVRVVPIRTTDKNNMAKANEIYETLKSHGIRTDIDTSDKTPGYKFSECEMKGIPLRLEIGPKDIEKGTCILARRDTGEKIEVKTSELEKEIKDILEKIQKNMFDEAKKFLDAHIDTALTKDELVSKMNNKKGFIKAMHCGCEECEVAFKDETGISSRCIPMEQEQLSDKCVVCGKPAKYEVIWGKSY
ncbi:MAG: proline--tRNA ligase [Lachnospiraceae bacterium]|nr:proline--tRNA ligase [Lachnospiraceae bacterium]